MTTTLDRFYPPRPPPPGSLSPSRIWSCRVSAREDTCCRWKSRQGSAAQASDAPIAVSYQSVTAGINTVPTNKSPYPNDSSCWTNAGPWGQHAIYPSVAGLGGDAGIQGIPAVMTVIYTGLCVFGMFEDGSSAKSMSVQGHLFQLFPAFSWSNFDGLFFLLVSLLFLGLWFHSIHTHIRESPQLGSRVGCACGFTECLLYVCTVLLRYVLRCNTGVSCRRQIFF